MNGWARDDFLGVPVSASLGSFCNLDGVVWDYFSDLSCVGCLYFLLGLVLYGLFGCCGLLFEDWVFFSCTPLSHCLDGSFFIY